MIMSSPELVKSKDKTSQDFGKKPDERNMLEYINLGVINLNKPSGPTSHQVVAWVKKILNIEKAGHGGTLDPRVTGVLPVALGESTKTLKLLLSYPKEYVGVMRMHKDINEKNLRKTCSGFVGEIRQMPPVRSAVKRQMRKRKIYYLNILEIHKRDVLFRVGCESGTYIRTLCNDIGKKIGGAHLQELRRTKGGGFNEKDSVTLQVLKDAYVYWKEENNEKELRKIIMPMEKMLEGMHKIKIRDSAVDALCHGANLAVPGIASLDRDIKKDETVAILTLKDEGVAYGKALMTSKEIMEKNSGYTVDTQRVLMEPGTYPKCWGKK
ncbi:MAG: RNA-guided pseudouridylation complex pseudouridine synthase subunit Cbf5 [Candidatus Thermoplasmatota archaeon]|nr:RNA-guided pseudouridylation complex pseudouridine synthase subunit Cbf5 [Candidatus Thermoplasmatota archaeon]